MCVLRVHPSLNSLLAALFQLQGKDLLGANFWCYWSSRCRGDLAELHLSVVTSQSHPAGWWPGVATDSTPVWSLPATPPCRQHWTSDTASTAPCTASASFLYFYQSSPPRSADLGFWLTCTRCLIYTSVAISGLSYRLQFRHLQSRELVQQGWTLLKWAIST